MNDARRRAILGDDDLQDVRNQLLNLEFAEPANDRMRSLYNFLIRLSATLPAGDANYAPLIDSIFNVRDGLIRTRIQNTNAPAITNEEITAVTDSVLDILKRELNQPVARQCTNIPSHFPNRATTIHNFLCGLAQSNQGDLQIVGGELAALFGRRFRTIQSGEFELQTDKVIDDFTTHRILREVLRVFTPRNQ